MNFQTLKSRSATYGPISTLCGTAGLLLMLFGAVSILERLWAHLAAYTSAFPAARHALMLVVGGGLVIAAVVTRRLAPATTEATDVR